MRYFKSPACKKIAFGLLLGSYVICLVIFLSGFLPTDKYLALSLLHPLTPVCLLFLAISFLVLLMFRHWKLLIVPTLLLAVNAGNWSAFFQISKKNLASDKSFKVLSYNVGFFSIPSVFSKQYFDTTSAERGQKIMDWLSVENTQVVCIQEFFTDGESKHHNYLVQLESLGYTAHVFAIPNPKNKTLRGLITCSRFPIVGKGEIFISKNRYNGASYTDLLIGDDTIRVVNVHLESMELYLGNKKMKDKINYFWNRYTESMATRTKQVRLLNDFVSQSSYPIIVAGDFNEMPYSFNHKQIRRKLTNSFEHSGSGFGLTFLEGKMPIRIDHQYFSSQFDCGDFEVNQDVKLSNHYPVHARYELKR